jgi:hypothetical protein
MKVARYERCYDVARDGDVAGQSFMVEFTAEEFAEVMEAMSDAQLKVSQGWFQRREMEKVVTHLLLVRMGNPSAREVLACCSSVASE